jgi:hypothetical protein
MKYVNICEGLLELQRLKKMVLGPNSLKTMALYDPLGTGFIRRGDMLRALSELGDIYVHKCICMHSDMHLVSYELYMVP